MNVDLNVYKAGRVVMKVSSPAEDEVLVVELTTEEALELAEHITEAAMVAMEITPTAQSAPVPAKE